MGPGAEGATTPAIVLKVIIIKIKSGFFQFN